MVSIFLSRSQREHVWNVLRRFLFCYDAGHCTVALMASSAKCTSDGYAALTRKNVTKFGLRDPFRKKILLCQNL